MSEQSKPEPLSAEHADLLMGHEYAPQATAGQNTESAEFFAEEILAEVDGEVSEDQDLEEVSDEEEAAYEEEVEGDEYEDHDEEDAEVSDEESEETDGSDEEGDEDESDHEAVELPDDAVVFQDDDGNPVTAKEARLGYLRQADYTRKNQAVAQERDQTIQARQEALSKVQEATEALQDIEIVMSQMAGSPPDPQLRASDPGEYAAQVADWQNRQQMIQGIRQRAQQERQKLQQMNQAQMQDVLANENQRLMERIPEWRDPQTRQKELGEIADHFMGEYGYTPQELSAVQDHRAMDIMRKAMRYDQMQAEGRQTLEEAKGKAPKPKPKSRPKPKGKKRSRDSQGRFAKDRQKRLQEQSERLSETGNVFDAARAIETFLGDDLL